MLDRANQYLPYGYFSARCGMLLLTFGGLTAWGITGFNIVEGAVPLIGLQWSTFATFSFFFYLIMVNFHEGGLENMEELKQNLVYDIKFLKVIFRHPRTARSLYQNQYLYRNKSVLDPLRAALVATLLCISALFLFESIWVPLYDYFQFNSIAWPVYFAVTSFPPVILRNVGLFVIPLVLVPLVFSVTLDSPTKERFSVRWRSDFAALWLVILAASFWLAWITFPHQIVDSTSLKAVQVIGPEAMTFSLSNCYIFPAQHFFPQNTYTFYPCSLYGQNYTPPQILGFFDSDPWVHLVNVLTKFATFAAVCYPFMGRVRRNT
jgi:hypothetical protein